MTLPDGSALRPSNAGDQRERVAIRYEEHGCHLREKALRRLVGMAVKDLPKCKYTTKLPEGFNRSKTREITKGSLDELLEVVKETGAGRIETLTVRAQTPSGDRFVLLAISPEHTVIEVRANPNVSDYVDWASGRADRLREQLLEGRKSKICVRGTTKLQAFVGALMGSGVGVLASVALFGHAAPLAVVILAAAGCIMGVLAGAASAYRYRTVILLKDRSTVGWVTIPAFDQTLLILLTAVAAVAAVMTLVVAPGSQTTPPTPVTSHAPAAAGRK